MTIDYTQALSQLEEAQVRSADISEHLSVLMRYASMCNHVTELGTGHAYSTSAFVLAKPLVIRTYDLNEDSRVSQVAETAVSMGIDFRFIQGDVLELDLEPTDLLFIDTWHCHDQMGAELRKVADIASKYLILHDTETYGFAPEEHNYTGQDRGTPLGIWPAVAAFMRSTDVWRLHQHRANNNGLTIFERRGP